jgi:MFS family permease
MLLGTMVASGSRGLSIAAVIGAGFVFGPVFPTLIALMSQYVPAALFGRAVGIFFAIGSIGWVLIPMAIGAYAARTSVQRGFSIAMASAGALLVIMLVIHNGWFTGARSKPTSMRRSGTILAAPALLRSDDLGPSSPAGLIGRETPRGRRPDLIGQY